MSDDSSYWNEVNMCWGGVLHVSTPSPTQRHFNREDAKKDVTKVCEYCQPAVRNMLHTDLM